MTPGDDDDEDTEHEPIELPASEQPTVDAGNPKEVKKRKITQKLLAREDDRFWAEVFKTDIGRRCMWKLIDNGHPFDTRFACGPNGFPQTEATWFHAGEQNMALGIYHKWLEKFPLEVRQMHLENDHRFKKKDE